MGNSSKYCVVCGKYFDGGARKMYCSDECKKEMTRRRYRDVYHKIRFGDADIERLLDEIEFESWEDKYNDSDLLTQLAMLQKKSGKSYGQLSYLHMFRINEFNEILKTAIELSRKEEKEIIKELKKQNEKVRRVQEKKNAWKKFCVPVEQRTGLERCRNCCWLDMNDSNNSGAYRCTCPALDRHRTGAYKKPSAKVCKNGFGVKED